MCELLQGLEYRHLRGDLGTPVEGLAYDSRKVCPGALFACLSGLQTDGHLHIEEALSSGAAAIMVREGKESLLPAQTSAAFAVTDTRMALAKLAAGFYDHPTAHLNLVGVTGTNGKSTTVHLIDLLHRAAGFSSGTIGTLAYRLNDESRPAERTTPEAPDLQALLAEMHGEGITHVAMEVSSHALAQYRADGCLFRIAVFTNLSRDHLDYHVDEEDYFSAKLRLFADSGFLPAQGKRVNIVNADDEAGKRIASSALGDTITYGVDSAAEVRASDLNLSAEGSEFSLDTAWGQARISTPLLGRFNIYNVLAALSVALAQEIPLETAVSVLGKADAPTGRFQRLPSDKCTVVVDYAHTPDGLGKVLKTARDFCRGRLFVVFGCGGDRDQGKRPVMGEMASRLADVCLITSDNPRSEDPEAIISQILSGIPAQYKEKCLVEPDRAQAIRAAISRAGSDDLVLLAGKGHETYQIFADRTIHFDDREVAQEALEEKP
ncbi:MAG: UDP-N-acetylmuramoyl-L-alanyl-D-glutamate--2,6-diaminopimelate ligase [Armatimonadetes bacterium]|nr:UDP-N-acetylmuramoyl-L-alanyl-D-glutamate--2,6-diaminopimelate ligase [Armatimonadota bacterium]NIM24698.1 UDP-N-acetylmuramoyl-L-alanyl-D-glutamate--2,6-diaminopimelate ligase [Armatimonadota bacterium]NIM68578.1 UDP-N-acetylmuramoyl-L-alanyl-D-glutamate--2,6-diaminopimelate ligase [Armatimonadota bacterium]NIM77095.1 UDP-N-acetylmuramoyl-L-alanyl-D-glutamate--2,6-diaminopimelate ligase [Armatimonadota bacterium]NIN06772.1 UDP-N-acetylmuramoyl-L-alanyl-D-glutamate--2,6-diaminopimelate ligas